MRLLLLATLLSSVFALPITDNEDVSHTHCVGLTDFYLRSADSKSGAGNGSRTQGLAIVIDSRNVDNRVRFVHKDHTLTGSQFTLTNDTWLWENQGQSHAAVVRTVHSNITSEQIDLDVVHRPMNSATLMKCSIHAQNCAFTCSATVDGEVWSSFYLRGHDHLELGVPKEKGAKRVFLIAQRKTK